MKCGTTKIKCACLNEGQDKLHGEHVRVANATAKQDKDFIEVRCTVCQKVSRVNPSQVK